MVVVDGVSSSLCRFRRSFAQASAQQVEEKMAFATTDMTQTDVSKAHLFNVMLLKTTSGSGPNGEHVDYARMMTLKPHPVALSLSASSSSAAAGATPRAACTRTDHDIGPGGLAFTIDNILSLEEARALRDASEAVGYTSIAPAIRTPPGMRQNQAAHWIAQPETARLFFVPMFHRFKHLLPQEIMDVRQGTADPLYEELSHRIAHYRYDDGDVFNPHTDGEWPGQGAGPGADGEPGEEVWPGVMSRLSMLLYLNEASPETFQGGETLLYHTRDRRKVAKAVNPRMGSALFFRHGNGPESALHEGSRVRKIGESKYVVRLNILYGQSPRAPLQPCVQAEALAAEDEDVILGCACRRT